MAAIAGGVRERLLTAATISVCLRAALREPIKRLARAIEFGAIGFGADRVRYLGGRGTLRVLPGDRRGAKLVRVGGVLAPPDCRLWLALLALRPPSLVLDVGANYGEMTLVPRFPAGCRVVAVEPQAALAEALEAALATRRDRGRFEVVRAVASDAPGRATLAVDPAWRGTGRVAADGALTVPAVTLDALCTGRDLRHVAFKTDVEGHEGRVLDGMAETLASAGGYVGMVEFHRGGIAAAGDDPARVLRRLMTLGRADGLRLAPSVGGLPRFDPARDPVPARAQFVVASEAGMLPARYGGLRLPPYLR